MIKLIILAGIIFFYLRYLGRRREEKRRRQELAYLSRFCPQVEGIVRCFGQALEQGWQSGASFLEARARLYGEAVRGGREQLLALAGQDREAILYALIRTIQFRGNGFCWFPELENNASLIKGFCLAVLIVRAVELKPLLTEAMGTYPELAPWLGSTLRQLGN